MRPAHHASKIGMHKRMTITLDDGYKAMAADKVREAEAVEWSDALPGDVTDAAR